MNIMIADDEYIIRTGVASAVKKIDSEMNISAEAADGEEAFSKATELKPDIIIVDINMPNCDGLSFIKKLKSIPDYSPEIIILTGFREFDYVQRALEYGASAFLLKPVKRDVLAENLEKCKQNVLRKQKIATTVLEYNQSFYDLKNIFLSKLLTGTSFSEDDIKMRFKTYSITLEPYFLIVGIQSEKLNHDLIFQEFNKYKLNQHFCRISSSFSCLLLFTQQPNVKPICQTIEQVINSIKDNTDAILHIGISSFYNNIDWLSLAYYESLEAALLADDSSNIKFYSITQAKSIKKREINDAINIIARDYQKPLTVNQIADELNISPSHLMHSFKNETGKTFNVYLTEYRMKMAIKMLQSGQYRIYEIADRLGYQSTKHFSRLFKKYTGHSPSEYTNGAET